ncbi:DUF4398 domain-containing protein [Peredibacter starrii]|uniref:DUF4398 domain-containing protein n=1 Tax=Peredibacter starrii TaxID=28202 RepID=A0AAX4HSK8_9BACT|nr:DUF4398 domain-containing protein [Peredibacter starrii]WPU66257.1 DUF4398 domain-containing protein [Peredibacter starrii]
MRVSLLFVLLLLGACGLTTTRPKTEMSLAQAAFMAAKEAGADIHASNLFRKAEDYYLKAKSAYRRKYFNKAQEYALLSKKYSEQAEYSAVRKKALEGNAE